MNAPQLNTERPHRVKWLLGVMVLLVAISAMWGPRIRKTTLEWLLIRSDVATQEAFDEVVQTDGDPLPFLEHMWATGKIVHRQLVAQYLKGQAQNGAQSDPRIDIMLTAGAIDVDASVRELSLGALAERKSPQLIPLAQVQLSDPDPLIRLLGLQYYAKAKAQDALPVVIRLLDDPDPRVVTRADAALRAWTGDDFGVRAVQSVAVMNDDGRGFLAPANVEAIRRGVERRKEWWAAHSKEYPAVTTPTYPPAPGLPTSDFTLPDLSGRTVRLSEFRGKVVVLNFWTTWCTACRTEIPDLIALQREYGDRLVILGVSLDGVPDSHDHRDGHEEIGHDQPDRAHNDETTGPGLVKIRQKVERFAKSMGIPYRVLLDPENNLGGRFNGGELPTNVLIDVDGKVRRRFIGARPLQVWKNMLAGLLPVETPVGAGPGSVR